MDTTEHKTNMDSNKLALVLNSSTSSHEDRLNVYQTFSSKLKTEEGDASEDFLKNCKLAIHLAQTDMYEKLSELSHGSLKFLGLCIHDKLIVDMLSPKENESIIQGLCKCIMQTEDKAICARALWCLSNQIVNLDILSNQLSNIIDSLDYSFSKPLSQSVLVEHEAVSVVIRLLQQIPKKMQEKSSSWSHHVYALLGHGAVKVREKALQALTLALPALLQNPNGLIPTMVADVKTKMANELKKLYNNRNEVYVLRVWSLLVQLLGKELHCVFINQLLPIVELGFKSSTPNIKYEAFSAWKYLVENFASNPAIIGDQKRIKLLMQVFKINNAKTETVAMKKLEVWWYFVKKLDTKILTNFDMVCTPLLRFCVGGKWAQASRNTPASKPVNTPITLANQGTVWPSFSPLQKKGLEVIARLLTLPPGNLTLPPVELELDALNDNVILGPALFLKQSSIIAYATVELMCSIDAPDNLVLYIWCLLVEHMRLGLEAGLKVDCRDALSSFLCDFSTLVLSRQAPYSAKYKLFLAVSKLPKKILCSTAYNITSGEKIHGTPALFLTELLLTPSMFEEGISQENYMTLFGNLIEMGMSNPSGALEFCQAVIQVLDRHAGFAQHPDQLFKLWLVIATPLLEHITKTREVNQGDVLEHNFASLYQTLIFPVKWLFGANLSQGNIKSLLKMWRGIYRTFVYLAALVVNASTNVTCEHLGHLILEELSRVEKHLEDFIFVDCMVQLCEFVLSCVNFSSNIGNSPFGLSSPGKWSGKRKQKPLKNLHSFVTLLGKVTLSCQNHLKVMTENNNNIGTPEKQSTSGQSTVKGLVGVLTSLFTGITTTSSYVSPVLEKCAEPVSGLFALSKKANTKLYPVSFLPKLDKLWQDIIYCSQNVYTGMYDSDFLLILAPLLEVNFMHNRRLIKQQTVQFWNATFGQSSCLTYPESLRLVLSQVKLKVVIMLPSWISAEIQIIEETPTSQFSESSSQVADEIPLSIMLSPSKMHGSMLKNAAPSPLPSFVAKPKPVKDYSANKKLSISELKDKDFVVIDSPQNKCRILTQHQQEVLRERKFSVPAMYNSLDQSQDSLAFSNLMNASQPLGTSNNTSTKPLENKKSNVENTVKAKKKVNFLDQSNKLNILTNPFSKDEIVKEFAFTSQENLALNSKIHKDMAPKLSDPVSIQSVKAKDIKSLKSPGKVKNVQDSTPLQNWLSISQSSKDLILLEPHMSSLIEDSTCDLPVSKSILPTTGAISRNLTFVEETQSPIKVSPEKLPMESISETPVKTPVSKIDRKVVNIRPLSFDLEEIATNLSVGPTEEATSPCADPMGPSPAVNTSHNDRQIIIVGESESSAGPTEEMSPCADTMEPSPAVNTSHNDLQIIIVGESESSDISPSQNSDTNCKALVQDIQDPHAENLPMDSADQSEDIVSNKNSVINKRKISTSPNPAGAKRTKLCPSMDSSPVDSSCATDVKCPNSSDDFLDETLDDSLDVSSNLETDDSRLHSDKSHEEEESPSIKRLTGSRKRKPLKVTKLSPTSSNRRISPVKTRSWGKVLRTRKRAIQATNGKDEKLKQHYKRSKRFKILGQNTDPAVNSMNKNVLSVPDHKVLDDSLQNLTKTENFTELLPMKVDLKLKPIQSEENMDSPNGSIVENDKSISSDHDSLQVESFNSSPDVMVKTDSPIEKKMVGNTNQDSISADDSINNTVAIKQNSPNLLVAKTQKKSLRLRSGNRGFPSKFSDSYVYGIKISTSPTSSAKKNLAQKSVKTSPPNPKSVNLNPKDTSTINKLSETITKKHIVVDKEEKSKNKEPLAANKDTSVSNQVELNAEQAVDNDNVVLHAKTDITDVVQSVPNTDSLTHDKFESIADNNLESNVHEPVVSKDMEISSNETEPTLLKSVTEDNSSICNKIDLPDMVQSIATKDDAKSDTEVVVQPCVDKDYSISNKSMPDNIPVQVATPSTKTDSTPVQEATPSTKTDSTPVQVATPSTKTDSTPVQVATPSTKTDSTPVQEATPSTKTDSTPVQVATPSTKTDSTPVQEATPSTKTDSTPVQEATPSTKTDSTPVQEATPSTKTDSTPVQEATPSTKTDSTPVQVATRSTKTDSTPVQVATRSTKTDSTPVQVATRSTKTDSTPVQVATPSTKPPPPACDTPDNVPPYTYSPSPVYSPTTGILKKRLSIGSGDTPSPPNKHRRVSFADPIFEEKTLPSPVSHKRRLTPCSSRSSRRSLLTNYKKRDSNLCISNSPNGSQSSYNSSQESQLNCTDPISPHLVTCQEPLGQILPQLTSSIWSRGLGQLLRAKKIHTVGDLASMSEYDIHNLPVRSPKVSNVKNVLTTFKHQRDVKRDKSPNTSITEIMAAVATGTTTVSAVTTALNSSITAASCESDKPSLEEKENKSTVNIAAENPVTKTPEKMETSLTVPKLDPSSSLKSDVDDPSAASNNESNTSHSMDDATQDTVVVSANSDNNSNLTNISMSIPVFENPEASSTPLKTPATKTKNSGINGRSKDGSSRLAIDKSPVDLLSSIKPICLEKKFSTMNSNRNDVIDDGMHDKGDDSTVEDDVKSILENSGALLEEVEKLSQSVQELERSPRSPKFVRKTHESPELESTEGFDVYHLLPNMAEGSSKNLTVSVDTTVQKDLELLPTLKDLSTKFTEKEIQELPCEEIKEAHEYLQQLCRSIMNAVIPWARKK